MAAENKIQFTFKDIDVHINKTQILNKICGTVKQGEMLAVMGLSGAGKSTLLDALSGHGTLSNGKITLQGEVLSKRLRRKVAHVLQEDVFFPNLTLRETLIYSAHLRLSDKMPDSLKNQRVEEILNILQLTKCATTVIGSETVQGLSAGEKKMTSIAIGLLTNPLVLLIDEPTIGLDNATAFHLMKIIQDYTERSHKTVIVTIHQPSSQIFHMFHNLLLLVDGQVGYFGEASKVLDLFSELGLHCIPQYNPADFILEQIIQDPETAEAVIEKSKTLRKTEWPKLIRNTFVQPQDGFIRLDTRHQISVKSGGTLEKLNKRKTQIGTTENGSPQLADINEIVVEDKSNSMPMNTDEQIEEYMDMDCEWPTSFLTQYKVLTIRSMKQARHRILSKINIVQTIVMTIAASVIWFRTERAERTVQDRMGILFFSFIYWGFITAMQAICAFGEERAVVNRERAFGVYRLSAYYLAKQSSELPLALILPFGFMFLFYWCAGLSYSAVGFFSVLFTILLSVIAFQGIGHLFGISLSDNKKCQVTGAVFLIISMLLGGFFQRHFANWTVWLKYLSVCHYIFHALMHIEFGYGDPLKCLPVKQTFFASCQQSNVTTVSGMELLHSYEITWPLWAYYIVLMLWLIIARILGYIVLRFVNKLDSIKCRAIM